MTDSRSHPPRIGLSTYREPAAWGVWSTCADLLPTGYTDSVHEAGGAALLLPPGRPATAPSVLQGVHGLLLAGGADVDPARYGEIREPATQPARPDRDEWEITLVRAAVAVDLPVLAVCRGMQILNVALGGTLIQDLPTECGSDLHCPTVGVHERHTVSVAPGTRLAEVVGASALVATYHHQAVRHLGARLKPCAWAEDGITEGVELTGPRWVLGVQWHPEAHDGAALFGAFVEACRVRRDAAGG